MAHYHGVALCVERRPIWLEQVMKVPMVALGRTSHNLAGLQRIRYQVTCGRVTDKEASQFFDWKVAGEELIWHPPIAFEAK